MSVFVPPAGYRQSAVGGTLLVARDEHHDAMRRALGSGTLHGWAATQPRARAMQGRNIAWATTLGDGTPVVVRHSRHGGALAGLTRDLFLAPSRAPRELDAALRLQAAGVRTATVIGYAVYRAFGPFCRADVATALIDGADLPATLATHRDAIARQAISDAVARLNSALWSAGAHHPDLNAKNIMIARRHDTFEAWVIDVDRVSFHAPRDASIAARNVARLIHSLHKWQASQQLSIAPDDLLRMGSFGQSRVEIPPR